MIKWGREPGEKMFLLWCKAMARLSRKTGAVDHWGLSPVWLTPGHGAQFLFSPKYWLISGWVRVWRRGQDDMILIDIQDNIWNLQLLMTMRILPGNSSTRELPSSSRRTCVGRKRVRRTCVLRVRAGSDRGPPARCRGRAGGGPPWSIARGCAGWAPWPPGGPWHPWPWSQSQNNWDSIATHPTITLLTLRLGRSQQKYSKRSLDLDLLYLLA